MLGYQEIVTDPSYAGQIVTLTYPQVGNYGVCEADAQCAATHLRGLVVRDMCRTPSNWRSSASLPDLLRDRGVVAIEGVDTRALTLAIRDRGAMRAAISTVDLDPAHLVARVQASPRISEHNYVPDVSARRGQDDPRPGRAAFFRGGLRLRREARHPAEHVRPRLRGHGRALGHPGRPRCWPWIPTACSSPTARRPRTGGPHRPGRPAISWAESRSSASAWATSCSPSPLAPR